MEKIWDLTGSLGYLIRIKLSRNKAWRFGSNLRALALGNSNAKCKENLAFVAPKTLASENCKQQYCKIFCNTATVQF